VSMPILSSKVTSQSIRELTSLAVRGLVPMFDPDKQLFCYRLRRTTTGLVREGVSRRYTTMALLGLDALRKSGVQCPFDTDAVFRSCADDPDWIQGVGDLGLLIWVTAEYAPERLDELFRRVNLEKSLERFADARKCRTMELAWFLAGLCHATMASPQCTWPLGDLAVDTYHLLQENRGESGLFGHLARTKSVSGVLRGRIGTFADQVYPIYALSKLATVFKLEEPLDLALECALIICRLQGSQGQWWRFYDADSGRVVCRYPVYSVDQYGLAPLALFELERATGRRFQDSIYRGLDWVYGSNELGEDLRIPSRQVIWTCILPRSGRRKYWETAESLIRPARERQAARSLRVLHESRPYELGLLLCSFASHGVAEI
jgi:hypothetical protein